MATTKRWYVLGEEPAAEYGGKYTQVWGPFDTETDARAFAMDVFGDNGWETVEPHFITPARAAKVATQEVIWPYNEDRKINMKKVLIVLKESDSYEPPGDIKTRLEAGDIDEVVALDLTGDDLRPFVLGGSIEVEAVRG